MPRWPPDDPVVDIRAADGLTTAQMLAAAADLAIGTDRPPLPYRSVPLALLPIWAYVRRTDPWSEHHQIGLDMLLTRPLITVPVTFAARAMLDAALAAHDLWPHTALEAANGTIAQALAAAGRGVAVVSDDLRFDLLPVAIDNGGSPLHIRRHAASDPRGVAAPTVHSIVRPWPRGSRTATAPPTPPRTGSIPLNQHPQR